MSALPEMAHATAEAVAMAMRVAAGKRRKDQADQDYKTLQADAQAVFAGYRRRGFPQIEVRTPGGIKVALISIETGSRAIRFDDDALTGVIAASEPEAFKDVALPAALADPEVVALLAERFPQYVAARIRPDVLAQYEREAAENDGRVFLRGGTGAGDQVQVAEIEHMPASGKYSVRWESKGMALLGDAIDAGEITEWGEITGTGRDQQEIHEADGGDTHAGDEDQAADSARRLEHAREQLGKQATATRGRRTTR
jgi:hypothetical protein